MLNLTQLLQRVEPPAPPPGVARIHRVADDEAIPAAVPAHGPERLCPRCKTVKSQQTGFYIGANGECSTYCKLCSCAIKRRQRELARAKKLGAPLPSL